MKAMKSSASELWGINRERIVYLLVDKLFEEHALHFHKQFTTYAIIHHHLDSASDLYICLNILKIFKHCFLWVIEYIV